MPYFYEFPFGPRTRHGFRSGSGLDEFDPGADRFGVHRRLPASRPDRHSDMEPAHTTRAHEVHLLGTQAAADEQFRTALALRRALQHRKTTGYAVRMPRREHGVTPERG